MLYRRWRGEWVESQHRGSWALVDTHGNVLDGAGATGHPVFARSAVKSLQAIPLVESGAADRWAVDDRELALVVASHAGERQHTGPVEALLGRLGLGPEHLQCGTQPGRDGSPLQHNCSGKHAGFLALALHLGVDPTEYLEPDSAGQQAVAQAIRQMCDLDEAELTTAVDGCGAPTFRLPLDRLALGLARLTNPEGLARRRASACRRITAAAAAHPDLLSFQPTRIDTLLPQATAGLLYAKIGAEGVQVVAVVGGGTALAVKIDDGDGEAAQRVAVALLRHLGLVGDDEAARLGTWSDDRIVTAAGRPVGRHEVRPG